MLVTKSGKTLEEVIKKAIGDEVVSQSEYDEIIHLAHDDGAIDMHERALLKEFHSLIADKVIKRVAK
jgi:hypothetical protein